uniref:FLYWCH-type domain-containing protein n=1 Tax=Panagrolaimus sp. ES5 TaxID=591445 RepID=A0AC34GQX9_9BILA
MIFEIKKSKGKKYPLLFVYGHKHYYSAMKSNGHHVWKCERNKSEKYCPGFALTTSLEKDAVLILPPTRHKCREYSRKKTVALRRDIEPLDNDMPIENPLDEAQNITENKPNIKNESVNDGDIEEANGADDVGVGEEAAICKAEENCKVEILEI